MKKLILFFIGSMIIFSCKNNSSSTSSSTSDTTVVTEDHTKVTAPDTSTRVIYRTNYQREMDSIRASVRINDSIPRHGKAYADWQKTKTWVNTRMDSINSKFKKAGNSTAASWDTFKMQMDTARNKLKRDWNTAMEKMKFKK